MILCFVQQKYALLCSQFPAITVSVSCYYRVHIVLLPCSKCPYITVFTVSYHYHVHSVLLLPCSPRPAIKVFTVTCHYLVQSVMSFTL